ncbi:hypothetical protein BDV3_004662 [Batrachochytrium dendrobatidis]|nr:Dephospho-CoA kinase cab5 [Batrachochytrium dendrobatidis]
MRIVGLTGGIATGKSTVSSFLTVQKIPVVDADLIARQVVLPDTPAYHSIISTFGSTILNPDKTINRTDLGALIFSNSELREKLNHITHPYIRLEMLRQVIWHFITGETLCVLDTPLLFEAKLHRWVHTVVVVYCSDDLQRERLMRRDKITVIQAQQRIDSQMPIDRKKSLADYVIDNTSTLESTQEQTLNLMDVLTPKPWIILIIWCILIVPIIWVYVAVVVSIRWTAWRRNLYMGYNRIRNWIKLPINSVPDASATRIPTLSTPGQTKQVGSNDNLLQYPTTLSDISLPPAAERFN